MFCKLCIEYHIEQNGCKVSLITNWPVCIELLRSVLYKTFEHFTKEEKKLYLQVKIKCANECGYLNFAIHTHEHQMYTCPYRKIKCPNLGCNVIKSAQHLETHFKICPNQSQIALPEQSLPAETNKGRGARFDDLYSEMVKQRRMYPMMGDDDYFNKCGEVHHFCLQYGRNVRAKV